MFDFVLPLRCKRDLRSFEILRSVVRDFGADFSGQPVSPIFKGKGVQGEWRESTNQPTEDLTEETCTPRKSTSLGLFSHSCVLQHRRAQVTDTFNYNLDCAYANELKTSVLTD